MPNIFPNKVTIEGTFSFEESSVGVKRIIGGAITVKVLGIGAVAEKFIVADVERSYDDAARFTQDWIDKKAAG